MLAVLSLSTGFGATQMTGTVFTANQMAWNALWANDPSTYWYDPIGSPILQGYDAVVAGALGGHVPPGVSANSSIPTRYFSADPYKSAFALTLIIANMGTFDVIDVVEFDSEYKLTSATTYAPATMVGFNMTSMMPMPWVSAIDAAAAAYVQAVIGFHLTTDGAAVWNALWKNDPSTYWYDPVGSPILSGYDAVVAGAAGGHVPAGATTDSKVAIMYYGEYFGGDTADAVLGLDLCFSFLGGACVPVVDKVKYDMTTGTPLIMSAETYAPAGLLGVNASAPMPAWEADTIAAQDAYLAAVKAYHL
jgi:hypothetical protein